MAEFDMAVIRQVRGLSSAPHSGGRALGVDIGAQQAATEELIPRHMSIREGVVLSAEA
ncbi:hypothetical protein [Streptomyces sp. NPDC051286]|uniref:hypothetical protein n=1 Tax=Streptomyces sp. NPDC051286 TaxID=3365647 RepID=UPI0037B35089